VIWTELGQHSVHIDLLFLHGMGGFCTLLLSFAVAAFTWKGSCILMHFASGKGCLGFS
jgi:hypothetical protein